MWTKQLFLFEREIDFCYPVEHIIVLRQSIIVEAVMKTDIIDELISFFLAPVWWLLVVGIWRKLRFPPVWIENTVAKEGQKLLALLLYATQVHHIFATLPLMEYGKYIRVVWKIRGRLRNGEGCIGYLLLTMAAVVVAVSAETTTVAYIKEFPLWLYAEVSD